MGAFATLATMTLLNSSLGTFTDAKTWYKKMLAAGKRQDEIYGERSQERIPPVVKAARQKFHNNDIVIERFSKTKRLCLNCGASRAANGDSLSQCSRCKCAYYCSRDCQVKDWKEHKNLCKML